MTDLYRDNSTPLRPSPAQTAILPPIPGTDPGFATRESFGALMAWMGLTGVGVEVGVYGGDNAAKILERWPGTLLCVDPWMAINTPDYRNRSQSDFDQVYERARRLLENYKSQGRCIFHREPSVNAARNLRVSVIDFVYIDGLHDYDSVTADLSAWAPLVKPGGVLAGHDYMDHEPPGDPGRIRVKPAVLDWCQRNGYAELDVRTTTEDHYPSFLIRLR